MDITAIDIGINLSNRQYNNDRDEIVNKSYENGIGLIITGCTSYSNNHAVTYIRQHPEYKMYCTIGLHPHNAEQYTEDFLKEYIDLLDKNKDIIVAVGEIGLDYNRMLSSKKIQKYVFQEMLTIAEQNDLPVFLHERDAANDFYDILGHNTNITEKSVVHCFTGTKDTVKKYLHLGCMIGITGWVCDNKRNKDLIEAIKYIPLDRIMIETDGPFLAPKNINKRRNLPIYLPYIWKRIAEIKEEEEDVVRKITLENSKRFFNLKI